MEQNLKKEVSSIRIVHASLVLGVFIFMTVTVSLNLNGGAFIINDRQMANIMLLIANVLAITSVGTGFYVFGKKMKDIELLSLPDKLSRFREASIVRVATMEGSAFFFVVGYLLFGTRVFLFEGIIFLILMGVYFPTNFRLAKEIKHDLRELN